METLMDTFFEIMPYFCVAYAAFHIGKHWALFQFSQNLSQDPDRMIALLNKIKEINTEVDENGMPEDAHPLELEEVNGQIYAYDKLTGEFLAQAPTKFQAGLAVSARYPEKKFWHPDLQQDSQTA